MLEFLYITTALHFVLGIYLVSRDFRNKEYLTFAIALVGIAMWSLSNAEFVRVREEESMYLWALVSYNSVTILLASVTLFANYVGNLALKLRYIWVIFAITAASIVMPYVPGLVIQSIDTQTVSINGGVGLPLLFASDFFYLAVTFFLLRKAILKSTGIKKVQLKIISIGVFFASAFGVALNLILPAFGNYQFVALGPSFSLLFLSLVVYTILRHHFLDIRVLFGRIVYYILLTSIPYATFFGLAWLYPILFGGIFKIETYLAATVVGIIFVLSYQRLDKILKYQVATRLINPGYDPAEIIDLLTAQISLSVDINDITEKFITAIERSIRPGYVGILIAQDPEGKFARRYYGSPESKEPPKVLLDEIQRLWAIEPSQKINQDDVYLQIGLYKEHPDIALGLNEALLGAKAKVILPLRTKDKVIGLYIFGQQEADSPYTNQDLDFLTNLTNSTNVAIERAMLYLEVQNFAATLQGKVDIATAELKQANVDLSAALQRIQEARRREHDMMDVMGHELRTPISIVRNTLAMLQRDASHSPTGMVTKDKFDKYIEMALESSRREISLIETLLSSTKIDANRLQLLFTQVDFKDVVMDGIEGQKMNLGEKPLAIQFYPPPEDIYVYCDRTRVQEIMDNFLSNAVKYTLQGTVIINQWQDANFGYISIKDTGIGIDPNDLQKLGTKFFRAKQYIKGADENQVVRPGGTGLGLYVTFELVRAMGGSLWINSVVGKGTNFTFSVPLHRGEKDKQFDQTFEEGEAAKRAFITLNGQAPLPPWATSNEMV